MTYEEAVNIIKSLSGRDSILEGLRLARMIFEEGHDMTREEISAYRKVNSELNSVFSK
jgi:hypothetical protein